MLDQGWHRPPKGWKKLNTDGCVQCESLKVRVGGVLKDEDGAYIQGFSINLGCCSVEAAELWAILHGMKMAWEVSSKCLLIEFDCLVVVQWLNSMGEPSNPLDALIQECKGWMRK